MLFLSAWAAGCSGDLDFHSDRGLDDMTCDQSGCWMCRGNDCEEYRCDATHQCPQDTECSTDGRCLPDGASGNPSGKCDSNDDCSVGQICTLAGECVKSPGGGPDATGDTSNDTSGPSDTSLPDHPDNACTSNYDCGLDGTCVNGGCFFTCGADGSCPPGQACDAGLCHSVGPENECTFNGECGTTHACVDGTCYVTCQETLDCPSHTRCSAQLCIADTTPVLQCSGSGTCPDGKGCVDGKCLASCGEGCGTGFECKFGYCSPVVSCFDQGDCGGSDCVNGACSQ